MLTITQAKSQFKLRINSKNTEVKNVAKYLKVNPQKVQMYSTLKKSAILPHFPGSGFIKIYCRLSADFAKI